MNNRTNQSLINCRTAQKIAWAILCIMIFMVFLQGVEALGWSNDSFNNSLSSENLTFTGNQNITRWLSIPSSVNYLTNGFLNLSGVSSPLKINENNYYNLEGLSAGGSLIPSLSVFNYKGMNYGIFINSSEASFKGYQWNGTGWERNDSLINGLSSGGNNLYTESFNFAENNSHNGESWNLAVGHGYNQDTIEMYQWNGTGWERNNTLEVGLEPTNISITYHHRKPQLFFYNNKWNLLDIQGENTFNQIQGYQWNGTGWERNDTFIGLTFTWGQGHTGDIFMKDNILYGISGANDGSARVHTWDNNSWTYRVNYGDLGSFVYPHYWSSQNILFWAIASATPIYKSFNLNYTQNSSLLIGSNEIWNYTGTFDQTNNRTSNLASTINQFLNATYLVGTNYIIPFMFHSDTAGILQYLNLLFNNEGFLENSQTYTTPVYDTSRHGFSINFSYDSNNYEEVSSNAVFVYNNSRYSSTLSSSSGNDYIYSSTIDIPVVTTETNRTFYWEINLVNSTGGTFVGNSTFYNQTVLPSNFSQCGTGENAVNYTIYSESTLALLVAAFKATFEWKLNESSSITKNISVDLSAANNYQFCIDSNETFFTDIAIELSAIDYHTKLYDFINQQFSNDTTHQKLYLLNDTIGSTIIIEVKDVGLAPLEGYTIKIYRYVQSTGEYILIHEDVTDIFGQITSKLIENDVKYRIEFYNPSGVLVKSTGDLVVACRSVICVLPFVIEDTTDPFARFDNVTGLSPSLTFNNDTNTFIFTWVDTSGDTATYNLKVERILGNGTTTICDNSTISNSGTLTCAVGDMKASYRAQAFRTVEGTEVRIRVLTNVKVGDISEIFGLEGLFWSFIILFTFIIIGIYSPAAGIIVYLGGFIMLGIIGIIYVNPAIIIAQIVIGALFIWVWRG